ncbi:cro/C1-type HTH DNA-binding domain protein [Mycobacterium intracellulare MIN_061107_1834]|nr:cro/C1-type HTH DNA-binding domain protein [Mycobacterium intracellulare MIN_061107_1834]
MKWNLRLAAANRGIWKASELQRMLADRGLVISAGKMSGLWSGNPNAIKLNDLDVICAVLDCAIDELLIPEPETVAAPTPSPTTSQPLRSVRHVPSPRALAPAGRCRRDELPALRDCAACQQSPRPKILRQKLFKKSVLPTQKGGTACSPAPAASSLGIRRPRARGRRDTRPGTRCAHDWCGETTNRCLDALLTLLAGRPTGDRVPLTEVRTRPHRLASRRRLVEILSHFDLLKDDTEPPIRAWIDRVTAELPPGFAEPAHHWLLTLLVGAHVLAHDHRGRSTATSARSSPSRALVHLLRASQGGHQGRRRRGAAAVSGKPAPQSDQGAAVAVPARQEECSGLQQPNSGFEEPTSRPGPPAHHR